MRTESLMLFSRGYRLDLGESHALADDIADLAFYRFQHAGERRTQSLLHLHHFQRENWRALLQGGADFRRQRHHGTGQWRHDLVLADLFLGLAAERIDPMQIEAAIAGPQIKLMAFDHGDDMGFHAVDPEIETAGRASRRCEGEFALADRERGGANPGGQGFLGFGPPPLPRGKSPPPPAPPPPTHPSPPSRAPPPRPPPLL